MAEVNMKAAKAVYSTLIEMLDAKGWKYQRHDEDLVIKSAVQGDDLPIDFLMIVRPKQEMVQFFSRLPSTMPEDKRVDAALAVCLVNESLVNGHFDLNLTNGDVAFRLTTSYRDSTIGKGALEYMMLVSVSTVDAYNDKFFMLAKNLMTIEQFIQQEQKD